VNEIVRRHEVLRTSFAVRGSEPTPEVGETLQIGFNIVDLNEVEDSEDTREQLLKEAGERRLGLGEFPLISARLLITGEEEKTLILTAHRMISDGWSMDVIFREKCQTYAAFSQGDPSSLEEVEIQYGDYAIWEREQEKAKELESDLLAWKERIRMMLGVRESRPILPGREFGTQTIISSREIRDRLSELGRREGATLYMTLLASFGVLLGRYSNQEEIIVGTPIVRREWGGAEDLVGPCVSVSVLWVELKGDPTFLEVLKRVKEGVLQAYEHRELRLEALVAELRPDKDPSTPLFDVIFMLESALPEPVKLTELELKLVDIRSIDSEPGLRLVSRETNMGLRHDLAYSGNLFDADKTKSILRQYRSLLEIIPNSPERRLSDFDFSSLRELS